MIKDELTPAILFVTISVVIIIYAINVVRYKLKLSSTSPPLPPGPPSLPIVGYLPFLKPDTHKQFVDLAHTYGPIFKFYIGSRLHVVINTPELVHEVVRTLDEIFANRDRTIAASILSFGGQDIAFSNYNSNWRNLRKLFVHELLSKTSLEACSSFRIGGANVVRRMVWNKKLNEEEEEDSNDISIGADHWQTIAFKTSELLGTFNVSDYFPSLAWFDLQGIERTMRSQVQNLDFVFKTVIDDRVKFNSKMCGDQGTNAADSKKKDFIQILLDMKENNDFSNIQIFSLLMGIMFAATETTTAVTELAMAEIMRSHHVMKRIQQELTEVVGEDNIVEEFHLEKLQYLNAAIKETHRLHPVAPFLIPRAPSKDCTLGGYTVPKNTSMILNVWSIHRDPRYWDNPLEFNPERFLTDEGRTKYDYKGSNMKYLPFGSGRRVCPGIPLAEKMQTLTLASLLHSFNWSLPEGEEHDLSEKIGLGLKKAKPLIAIPSQRLHHVNLYT